MCVMVINDAMYKVVADKVIIAMIIESCTCFVIKDNRLVITDNRLVSIVRTEL